MGGMWMQSDLLGRQEVSGAGVHLRGRAVQSVPIAGRARQAVLERGLGKRGETASIRRDLARDSEAAL